MSSGDRRNKRAGKEDGIAAFVKVALGALAVLAVAAGLCLVSRKGPAPGPAETLAPGLLNKRWQRGGLGGGGEILADACRGVINARDGTKVDCELRWSPVENGARLAYRLTPRAAVKLNVRGPEGARMACEVAVE